MNTSVAAPQAVFRSVTFTLHTEHARQFIDITDRLHEHVQASGVSDGLLVVTSQHTTAAIVVNEHEPELLKDLDAFLVQLAPEAAEYLHNSAPCEPGEGPNGHAHCQALLLNSSASIPIAAGLPLLGRYQRVFLVELDHARTRRVTAAVVGSA